MTTLDPNLQNKINTMTIPQGQSYDAAYDEAVRGIQTGLATLGSSRDLGKSRMEADFAQGQTQLAKQHQESLQGLKERLSNQGIFHSGINVAEQGKLASNVAERAGQLAQDYQRGIEDVDREYTMAQNDYNTQLQHLNLDRTRRETERADQAALEQAQQKANAELANTFRIQLDEMKDRLIKSVQPQPSPTGTFQLPPPPPPPAPASAPPPQNAIKPPPSPPIEPGLDVRALQNNLVSLGFNVGVVDGKFGPKTLAALRRYQEANGLPTDQPMTKQALEKMVSDANFNRAVW